MRVAIVIERFEPGGGGVETAAFELVRELLDRGLELTVVCRQSADAPPANVELIRLRAPAIWQPWRVRSFSSGAARATLDHFDVVHSFARTRHQDVYRAGGGSHADYMDATYRHSGPRRWLSPRHRTLLAIEEAVFRDRNQLIQCNARRSAERIAERYGVSAQRLAVIYNGVDLERFHPDARSAEREPLRRSLGLVGPTALFVGNGWARKDLARAIEGLSHGPPDAQLLVVGSGNARRYGKLAARHGVGDRVHFLGPRSDVDAIHTAADLFVLPTRYDPFSNACLEAMASGLPVATTAENGVAELIRQGENGFVFGDDFRSAFHLLEEPARLKRLGAAARSTAEEFTWARHADAVVKLYEQIRR